MANDFEFERIPNQIPKPPAGIGASITPNVATGGAAAASTPWGAIAYAVTQAANEVKRIITKTIDAIKSAITSLAAQFDKIKSVILDTVQAFQPFTIVMFNRAMLDLKATMGQIFLPILKQMISIVRAVADAIYNLPQGLKDAIRAIASIVLSISGFTAAAVGIIGVIAAIVAGVTGFVGGLLALVAVLAILSPILAILAGLFLPFAVIVGVISAALVGLIVGFVQLVRMMLRTTGGMNLLNNLMRGFDQIINTVGSGLKIMMAIISPILDMLMSALSDFGDALSELFDALKPLIAAVVLLIFGPLIASMAAFSVAIIALVKVLTFATGIIAGQLATLKGLSDAMPGTENKKSAYGLGWSHAEVGTDANALYNKITEEVLRNTRMGGGEAEQDPNKKVAKSMSKFDDKLSKALDKYLGGGVIHGAIEGAMAVFK